jgi:peptidoglycan LD-endopeptidase LytH
MPVLTVRACAVLIVGALAVSTSACDAPDGVGTTSDNVPAVVATATAGGSGVARTGAAPTGSAISSTTGSAAASASLSPTAPSPSPPQKQSEPARTRFVFPVSGNVSYAHNVHHDYPATDIIAACGLTVRAVTEGVVLEVNRVDRYDPTTNLGRDRGGLFVSILGDDGVRYYGSHFSSIARRLTPGSRVGAGQAIGKIGATGDAGACHLHFGISPVCKGKGDWWIRRGVIWPSDYLDAWRKGLSRSAANEIARWLGKHGCPTLAASGAS